MESLWKTIAKDAYESKPDGDKYLSKMWEEQCFTNFPVLYLASIYLHEYAQKHGCKTFLFATRDCCHWVKIFKKLYPDSDAHYFNCSRNMFENGINNNAFRQYVRSIVNDVDETIFVDIHGTGRRMFRYFDTEFGDVPHCLMLSATYRNYQQFPEDTYKYYEKGRFVNLIFNARGSPIEMLNYDLVGTLQTYLPETGPLRDPPEYDLKHVQPYHDCMDELVSRVEPIDKKFDLGKLQKEISHLYRPIYDKSPVISKWIKHVGNHKKNLGVDVDILQNISFEEVISDDTVHGLVWSGIYDDRSCAVKMIKLTSGEKKTKLPNENAPFHHQRLVKKSPMTPDAFKKEVKAMTLLSREGLVPKLYGHCIEKKRFDAHYGFIVMERVDGTVKDVILKRTLTSKEHNLVEETIDKLHKIAVHGDLKPSNIGTYLNEKGVIQKCCILDCQKVISKDDLRHEEFRRRRRHDWQKYRTHFEENEKQAPKGKRKHRREKRHYHREKRWNYYGWPLHSELDMGL